MPTSRVLAALTAAGTAATPALLTVAPSCPRCGRYEWQEARGPAVAGAFPTALRRCRACRMVVRFVWAPPGEVLAELQAAVASVPELEALRAHVDELREELAAAQAELQRDRREHQVADPIKPEDLAAARRALQGWRLRLATLRTQRRIGAALEPTPADMAVLSIAASG